MFFQKNTNSRSSSPTASHVFVNVRVSFTDVPFRKKGPDVRADRKEESDDLQSISTIVATIETAATAAWVAFSSYSSPLPPAPPPSPAPPSKNAISSYRTMNAVYSTVFSENTIGWTPYVVVDVPAESSDPWSVESVRDALYGGIPPGPLSVLAEGGIEATNFCKRSSWSRRIWGTGPGRRAGSGVVSEEDEAGLEVGEERCAALRVGCWPMREMR